MKLEVNTKVYGNTIEQKTEMVDSMTDIRNELSRKIINLEDQGIKEALISLGWTPPKEEGNSEGN